MVAIPLQTKSPMETKLGHGERMEALPKAEALFSLPCSGHRDPSQKLNESHPKIDLMFLPCRWGN